MRHSTWRLRILLVWAIEALSFGLYVFLFTHISFDNWRAALLAVAAIGLLNASIRPLLVTLKLSPTLMVFWTLAMVCNTLAIWLAGEYVSGVNVEGIWIVLLGALWMTTVNVSFNDLLAIDDDDAYFAHLISQILKLTLRPEKTDMPGILIMEIDGLSEPVLQRALENGYMPTLAQWIERGSHQIERWECDLSSQTSASQAGILLGDNFDIPAFRWYEKENKKKMVSNHPLDTAAIESRISSGDGLLKDGASRSNLFSGDAPEAIFTASTLTDLSKQSNQDFYPLIMGPYNFIRMVLLFIWEVILELRAARYQRVHNVLPRVHRGGTYPLLRASTTVLLRELTTYILIGDMLEGVPTVYATYVGYDEVAHHSGVERPDALDVLYKLDDQFDRLEHAAKLAPRPYYFIVLSDHGQSQGATFKQRYGMTLEDLVRQLVSQKHTVESVESLDASWGTVSRFFTGILRSFIPGSENFISRIIRRALKNRTHLDQVALGPYRDHLKELEDSPDLTPAEVMVLASGNLGLIYFTDWDERMSYEQINKAFPDIIKGLSEHPGIGFILVHSETAGPLAIGARGIHYLKDGRVEGDDPLSNFGPNAADHLLRTANFPHVADIMVNSFYDPEKDEVAAFEELVGSHGGLGGNQTSPFVMFPSGWKLGKDEIIGAPDLHAQLKLWLSEVSN
jgi:uncharacterized membrane protein YvlD (DUF360 family)